MNMKRNLMVIACCCLTVWLVPAPAHAEAAEAADSAEVTTPAASPDGAVACLADLSALTGIDDPLQMGPCFISVACADGSTVSCNGNNSCSTSGTNDRCVTCDGVQQGCCALSACEQCEINYYNCYSSCEFTFECSKCDRFYDLCLSANNCL